MPDRCQEKYPHWLAFNGLWKPNTIQCGIAGPHEQHAGSPAPPWRTGEPSTLFDRMVSALVECVKQMEAASRYLPHNADLYDKALDGAKNLLTELSNGSAR